MRSFTPFLRQLQEVFSRRGRRRSQHRRAPLRLLLEMLEDRCVPTVNLLSSYTGMNQLAAAGPRTSPPGFVTIYSPPDTTGAAGPTSYVETANQGITIYTPKATGTTAVTDSMHDFLFTKGGLAQVPPIPSGPNSAEDYFSDVTCVWDDLAQRFIVGVQDVNGTTSEFDLAVSKSASPATLTTADWYFYQVNTGETNRVADYPGNLGYNHDAFVFTLNENAVSGSGASSAVQVTSIAISDLIAGNAITPFQSDFNGFSLRPTVMHDSTAGDPMWLLESTSGNGNTINVIRETNELSIAPTFTTTTLNVNSYLGVVQPLQPDGTGLAPASGNGALWTHILKAGEYNNTIVASDQISVSATEDDARWYTIDVNSGTPTLKDQGNVSAGNNTYVVFPSIDIDSTGNIGMTYSESGTGTGQFMSMYITGRTASDPAGTMETPVLVQAGAVNNKDGREGDLAGISVDSTPLTVTPAANQTAIEGASTALGLGSFSDFEGNFWAANEWAATGGSWGTAIGQFSLGGKGPWNVDVSWGDGSPDATFTATSPASLGTLSHTYVEEGTKTVTVSVTDTADGHSDAKSYQVVVSDPPVAPIGGFSFTAVENTPSAVQTVATFKDPGGAEAPGNYSADVNWGDGTATQVGAGVISVSSGGVFTVQGSYTYVEASSEHGPYTIKVTIHHESAPTATTTSTATVSDPNPVLGAIVFTPHQIDATHGQAVSGQTVTVTTPYTDVPNDGPHTVTISWGDATPNSTVSATELTAKTGTATLNHVYTAYGMYTVTETVTDDGSGISVQAFTVNIVPVDLQPCPPPNAGMLQLVVGGTQFDDDIHVNVHSDHGQETYNVQIHSKNGNVDLGNFQTGDVTVPSGLCQVLIFSLNGNDNIHADTDHTGLPVGVFAGNGNDQVQLGDGNNTVMLGNGNDQVQLGNGNNSVTLGNGNDNVHAGDGTNTVTAGALGSAAADQVQLGNGTNDYVTLLGNGTDNVHVGDGNGDIVAITGDGNDQVQAGKGNGDTVTIAGSGNDQVHVGDGNTDSVTITGNGNDQIQAGDGNGDTATITGNGNDQVHLGDGNNDAVTITGYGNDQVQIGDGTNDSVAITGNGNENVHTGNGSGTVDLDGNGNDNVHLGKNWSLIP